MLMKKFLLTIAVALTALFATAQTKSYTDNLIVEINGEGSEPQETTINVTKNNDGTYCLSLNKFVLGGMIQVGNIVVDNIEVTNEDGINKFATVQNILIAPGDEKVDLWIGPMLGEVPVDLKGKMTDDRLYCTIDIDFTSTLGQKIHVTFGTDDITTGIEETIGTDSVKVIYDLTGRRVDTVTSSGIYIINGKKCFIK